MAVLLNVDPKSSTRLAKTKHRGLASPPTSARIVRRERYRHDAESQQMARRGPPESLLLRLLVGVKQTRCAQSELFRV